MPKDNTQKKSRKEVTVTKEGEINNALTDIRNLVYDGQAALSIVLELDELKDTLTAENQAARLTSLEALLMRCQLSAKSAAKHRAQASNCLSDEIDGFGRQGTLTEFEGDERESAGDGSDGEVPRNEEDDLMRRDQTALTLMEETGHGVNSEPPSALPTINEEALSGNPENEAPANPAPDQAEEGAIATSTADNPTDGEAQQEGQQDDAKSPPGPMEADEEPANVTEEGGE